MAHRIGQDAEDVAYSIGTSSPCRGVVATAPTPTPSQSDFERDVQQSLAEIKAALTNRSVFQLEDDPSFTIDEVATQLKVSTTKVYQLTKSGRLGSYKTGNQVRIKASHIRVYQQQNEQVVVEPAKRKSRSFDQSEADRLFGKDWDG